MRVGDYLEISTLFEIGEDGFNHLTKYLQFIGYPNCFAWESWEDIAPFSIDRSRFVLTFTKGGCFVVSYRELMTGNEITLEKAKQMIELAL